MEYSESPATASICEEVVTKISNVGCEDKPHRHKFCKYYGKVGTTASTVVWVVDQPVVSLGDRIRFINYDDIRRDVNEFYVRYLNDSTVKSGVIDKINSDGFIFIQLM